METEIELKVLNVNVDETISKLKKLWAKFVWKKEQKRFTYDFDPIKENSWIRLRTDWKKTTLTIKEIKNDNIDGTKELEITVDDFQNTNILLEKLWYKSKNYQENNRISYTLDDTNVEIDSRPLIPPYIEIEWKTIPAVHDTLQKLLFNLSQTTSINTIKV